MELKAEINGRAIIGNTYKELVFNCLQEVYNLYKHLPVEERSKRYINFFVDNYSYSKKLRDNVLYTKRVESKENYEKELAELFINGTAVCHQFAQALSLLSCFDSEIIIQYCYCKAFVEKENVEVGHVCNAILLNGKARIVDVSSMIHARDKEYKQDKSAFYMLELDEFIKALANEGIRYLSKSEDGERFILGAISYRKNFDDNYSILNLTREEKRKLDLGFNFWEVSVENNIFN